MKKIISLILAAVLCITLVGCNVAETIDIKENGKVTVNAKFTCSENEINTLKKNKSAFEQKNTVYSLSIDMLLSDDAIDNFIKESNKKGLTQTIDGVKYYTNTITQNYSSLNEFNQTLNSAGEYTKTDVWAYKDGSFFQTDDETKILNGLNIKTSYAITIKLPYKITETNCTKVNDYTVTYDESKNYIYVITEKSTAAWTKSANKEETLKNMAKKFYTPKKVTGAVVNYKTASSLKISWNPIDSFFVTGYKVEKKVGKGKWKLIKTVKSDNINSYDSNLRIFCIDKNISSNKEYSYRVRAYSKNNSFELYGAYSKVKKIKTADLRTKVKLSAKAGKGKVTLKIKHSSKNLSGYQITYSTKKNFKNAKKLTTKKFPVTIKKLKSGSKYYIKVRKYRKGANKNVYSDYSKPIPIKVK